MTKSRGKILIDARMIGPSGHGIALYVEEMAQSLLGVKDQNPWQNFEICFLVSAECPTESPVRKFNCIETKIRFLSLTEIFSLSGLLKSLNATYYISPSFSSLISYPCPHLIVLHDLNHLQYGGHFHKIYYSLLVKRAAQTAAKVFSVSHTSCEEIAKWLGVLPQTIAYAPNAVLLNEVAPAQKLLAHYGLKTGSFFMALNNPKVHKNMPLLLAAYEAYRQKSKYPWPLATAKNCEVLTKGKTICLDQHSYAEVMGLLKASGGLLMPSLYEGFSRPPVEASLLGVPVVLSDISVHREILSHLKTARFIEPQNKEGWVEAMLELEARAIAPASAHEQSLIRQDYQGAKLLVPFQIFFDQRV